MEKLSHAEARTDYNERQDVPPKDISYNHADARTVQPLQYSSCIVLESIVRALTEQVATLVQHLVTLLQQLAETLSSPLQLKLKQLNRERL